MTDEIIRTIPWRCEDDSCPCTWHKESWWIYSDGSYSLDRYTSGDHDDVESLDDFPTKADEITAWLEYARWVNNVGEDPLRHFPLNHYKSTKERWYAHIKNSIVGPVVIYLRRGRDQEFTPCDAPEHVREWLQAAPPRNDIRQLYLDCSWEDVIDAPGAKMLIKGSVYSVSFLLERRQLRSVHVLREELRKRAREYIKLHTPKEEPTP